MSLSVVALLAVLTAALAGGAVARRLGYPSILGELMAGIVLGPPVLGLLQPDDAVAVIGKLGVVLLMLYIGLHLDPSDLGRAATAGALASLGGFLVPAGLGFGLMMLVDGDVTAALFVAVAMGVTSLALPMYSWQAPSSRTSPPSSSSPPCSASPPRAPSPCRAWGSPLPRQRSSSSAHG